MRHYLQQKLTESDATFKRALQSALQRMIYIHMCVAACVAVRDYLQQKLTESDTIFTSVLQSTLQCMILPNSHVFDVPKYICSK